MTNLDDLEDARKGWEDSAAELRAADVEITRLRNALARIDGMTKARDHEGACMRISDFVEAVLAPPRADG